MSSSIHYRSLNIATKYEGRELQYQTTLADQVINPLPKDIYLYHKWRSEKHGKENGETIYIYRFNQLTEIAGAQQGTCTDWWESLFAAVRTQINQAPTGESSKPAPLVLAVCIPLMSRAHQLVKQAGELVDCDSKSSQDRYSCPTFIMSMCTPGGGIPLGVKITECEEVITEAITFLKAIYSRPAVLWTWLWDTDHALRMHGLFPTGWKRCGNHTNNYPEEGIRILKEIIFGIHCKNKLVVLTTEYM